MDQKANIYQFLQTQAIAGVLTKSDMAFFKKVCRWYSKTFHTPLSVVMECREVQWDEILTHYYEEQMEELSFNHIFEVACQEYIPELAEEFEKENQEYADSLLEEQQRTIERKKKKDMLKGKAPQATPQVEVKPPEVKMSFNDEEV